MTSRARNVHSRCRDVPFRRARRVPIRPTPSILKMGRTTRALQEGRTSMLEVVYSPSVQRGNSFFFASGSSFEIVNTEIWQTVLANHARVLLAADRADFRDVERGSAYRIEPRARRVDLL